MSTHSRGELARRLRDALLQVPGVSHLGSGSGVEVATHFAGGKVVGIRITNDDVEIQVAVDRLPLAPIISEIHEVARQVLTEQEDPSQVRVVIADIDVEALV